MSAEMKIPLSKVCQITGAPRSTIYDRRGRGEALKGRPGPKTQVNDEDLTELIRHIIVECPSPARAIARSEPGSAESTSSAWARTGCSASCGTLVFWHPSG